MRSASLSTIASICCRRARRALAPAAGGARRCGDAGRRRRPARAAKASRSASSRCRRARRRTPTAARPGARDGRARRRVLAGEQVFADLALDRAARLVVGAVVERAGVVLRLQLAAGERALRRGDRRSPRSGRTRRAGVRRGEGGIDGAGLVGDLVVGSKASAAIRLRRRSTRRRTAAPPTQHQRRARTRAAASSRLQRRPVEHEVAVARGHVVDDLGVALALLAAARAPRGAGRRRGRRSSRRSSGSGRPGSAAPR